MQTGDVRRTVSDNYFSAATTEMANNAFRSLQGGDIALNAVDARKRRHGLQVNCNYLLSVFIAPTNFAIDISPDI